MNSYAAAVRLWRRVWLIAAALLLFGGGMVAEHVLAGWCR